MLYLVIMLAAQEVVFQSPDPSATGPNLLRDPGFEIGAGVPLTHWAPFGKGYELAAGRSGRAISVRSDKLDGEHGAGTTLALNQTKPEPLFVSGWSMAEGVSGAPSSGYSLYVDCTYTDGTPLWGTHGTFATGTHGWERTFFTVFPEKPIRSFTLYCLFRGHTGAVRFDDVAVSPLSGGLGRFDGVPVVAKAPVKEGFLLRDQKRDDVFVALAPKATVDAVTLEVEEIARGGVRSFTARLATAADEPKMLTLYWIMRCEAAGGTFHRDIVRSERIEPAGAYTEVVSVVAGATGTISRYPLIAVSPPQSAAVQAVAVPMDQPVVTRLAYHAAWNALTVAFDVALDRRCLQYSGTVELRWVAYRAESPWGFRAAYERYQEVFAGSFVRRAPVEGIWMPFYDIAKVKKAEDFGFGFKEGDDNIPYDEAHGVLTFRYVEPQSHWLSLPKDTPRSEEAVIKHLTKLVGEGERQALATLSSGIWTRQGTYDMSILSTPWCDGAVFSLNPDPGLDAAASKARLNYNPAGADRLYAAGLDGEYLDSLEGWNDILNFREDHLRESSVPPIFDRVSKRPCLLNGFSVYAYTAYVAEQLHRRGRLLMANAVPHRFGFLCHFIDVAGTETNWKYRGKFQFNAPELMAYRRTMMGPKPYLFLQNTDWETWTVADSEAFMRWCLFWGMYPGFFSPDASSRHYFASEERIDRDRGLFKRYVPLVERISRAGWKPIALARPKDPGGVFVERWGDPGDGAFYLTVFNFGAASQEIVLALDRSLASFGGATELLSGRAVTARAEGAEKSLPLTLAAGQVAVLAFSR